MSTITKPKPKTKPKALKAGQEPRARRSVQAGFMMPLTEVDRESALDVLRHRCATLVRDCSTLTLDEAEKYIGEQLHRNRVGAFRAEYPGEPLLTTNQRGVVVEHQGRRGTLSWLEIAAEWVAAEEADADPSDTREAAQVRPFYGSTELGLMGSIELWQTALGQWVYLARARYADDAGAVCEVMLPAKHYYATRQHAHSAGLWDLAEELEAQGRGAGAAKQLAGRARILAGTMLLPGERPTSDDAAGDAEQGEVDRHVGHAEKAASPPSPAAKQKRPRGKKPADPLVNSCGVFKKFSRVVVPMPKSQGNLAAVLLARSTAGRWYSGYDFKIGPNHNGSADPKLRGKGHATPDEALLAGLATLDGIALRGGGPDKDGKRRFLRRLKWYRLGVLGRLQKKPPASAPSVGSVAKPKPKPKPKGATMTKPKSTTNTTASPIKAAAQKKPAPKRAAVPKKPASAKRTAAAVPWVNVETVTFDRRMLATAPVKVFQLVPAGTVLAAALVGKIIETQNGVYELVKQVTLE